jgi:hypothetical protein
MPISYNQPKKPKIYIAGKISRGNFRESIVPGLCHHQWGNPNIETASYEYLGPYTVNCKHGFFSGDGSHQSVGDDGATALSKEDVIATNMGSLANADLVVAYISTTDCFGTLMEIGWAIAKGKKVLLLLSPNIPTHEFWFIACQVTKVHQNVRICCLKEIVDQEIKKLCQ